MPAAGGGLVIEQKVSVRWANTTAAAEVLLVCFLGSGCLAMAAATWRLAVLVILTPALPAEAYQLDELAFARYLSGCGS